MSTIHELPGTPYQQFLLRLFVNHYSRDERVLAVLVYGSLGRGAEDDFSDLDIAVVIQNEVVMDIHHEIEQLRNVYAAEGQSTFFTEVAGGSGFLVLESLTPLDISYFTLDATHPTILAGFRALTGELERETILDKARANDRVPLLLNQHLHKALWHLLAVDKYLQRKHFWRALEALELARTTLLDIYAATHGGKRAHQIFEEQATTEMRIMFGRTLPQYFPESVSASLLSAGEVLTATLDIIEHHLEELSASQAELGNGERDLIHRLRARQAIRDDT